MQLLSPISTNLTWNQVLPPDAASLLLQVAAKHLPANERVVATSTEPIAHLALLYGSDKEHKAAAAVLLAKEFNKTAYRVDLGHLLSASTAKAEKHLDAVFKKATDAGAILLFDEADALMGKRTTVKDSHDKYANQEVEYVMHKIAAYHWPVLVSTTSKTGMPAHLLRRFATVVHFPS